MKNITACTVRCLELQDFSKSVLINHDKLEWYSPNPKGCGIPILHNSVYLPHELQSRLSSLHNWVNNKAEHVLYLYRMLYKTFCMMALRTVSLSNLVLVVKKVRAQGPSVRFSTSPSASRDMRRVRDCTCRRTLMLMKPTRLGSSYILLARASYRSLPSIFLYS